MVSSTCWNEDLFALELEALCISSKAMGEEIAVSAPFFRPKFDSEATFCIFLALTKYSKATKELHFNQHARSINIKD